MESVEFNPGDMVATLGLYLFGFNQISELWCMGALRIFGTAFLRPRGLE